MKEATGELNMTVVTIVAVAALLAFFYVVIWPNLQAGMALSSACSAANGTDYSVQNEDGSKISCSKSTKKCTYTAKSGKVSTRTCDDKA
jgi:hypothetical protein